MLKVDFCLYPVFFDSTEWLISGHVGHFLAFLGACAAHGGAYLVARMFVHPATRQSVSAGHIGP